MYLIGVKPGDWIRYNWSYYHTSINPPYPIINGTQIIVFDDLIQILDTNKTMVTFRQTYINPDNSTRWQTVSIADPTQPYYGHPEVAVHHYIMPSNLAAGSPLPEPLLFGCAVAAC